MSSATLPPSGKQRSYKKDRKEDPTQLPGPSTSQDDSHGLKRPRDATEKTNNQQPKKKRKRQSELGELHQGNPRHHDSSHTLNESSAGGPLAVYTSAELEEKAVKTQRKAERKIAKEKKRIERLQSLPAPAVQALGPDATTPSRQAALERILTDTDQFTDADDILRAVQSIPRVKRKKVTVLVTQKEPLKDGAQKRSKLAISRTNSSAPLGSSSQNELLWDKFRKTDELQRLADELGFTFKKGKFSQIEGDLCRAAVETYCKQHNISEEELQNIIFSKEKTSRGQYHEFWVQITRAIPERPMMAVYAYVKRKYNPLGKQGRWTSVEDNALKRGVADHGERWETISPLVGRTATDCRDRYRNYLKNKPSQDSGPWSRDEEQELTEIVQAMIKNKGERETEKDIFWTLVSEKMNYRRNRQQCRDKLDSLLPRIKNGGNDPVWNIEDSQILVRKVAALPIKHDSEIDWNTLRDETWNTFSVHAIGHKWLGLKRSVNGADKPYEDLIKLLLAKYPSKNLPKPKKQKRNKVVPKVLSSATISEDVLREEEGEESIDISS